MKLDSLKTTEQIESFLNGSQAIAFAVASTKDERYDFVESVLKQFKYVCLRRRDKGIVMALLTKHYFVLAGNNNYFY